MFNRTILVDYENVGNDGLAEVDKLGENDNVIIFYSKNANHITFHTHQKLLASKASIEYIEVTVGGKNALDIQLATYLGVLAGRDTAREYFVISKDNGFRLVEQFINQRMSAKVSCKPYIGYHFVGMADGKDAKVQEQAEQIDQLAVPAQEQPVKADILQMPVAANRQVDSAEEMSAEKAEALQDVVSADVEERNQESIPSQELVQMQEVKISRRGRPRGKSKNKQDKSQGTANAGKDIEEVQTAENQNVDVPELIAAELSVIAEFENTGLEIAAHTRNEQEEAVMEYNDAMEQLIFVVCEKYKEKKLKKDAIRNFLQTNQKKALYNMLRAKLGQNDGQQAYNELKKFG